MKTSHLKQHRSSRQSGKRGFNLVEMSVSIVILSLMAGAIGFAAASLDHSLVIIDISSALNDELSRQAEIVKSTNLDTAFGNPGPNTTTTIVIPPANVNQLQGFLPLQNNGGPAKPTIKWVLDRSSTLPPPAAGLPIPMQAIGHKTLVDRVTIQGNYNAMGIVNLSSSTVVFKIFDANQQ